MSEAPNNSQAPGIRELQKSKDLIEQVIGSLKSQQAILKQRGMNLPPMVLNGLGAVQTDILRMEDVIVDEQTELQQLRSLAKLSAGLTTSLDVDTVLQDAMDIVIVLTRAERGYIILIDENSGDLNFRVSRDDTEMVNLSPSDNPQAQVSTGVIRAVLDTHEPLLADNAFEDERLQKNRSIANLALRSVLCAPLLYKDRILGVVYVDNRLQAGIFTEREKNLLMAFANTAAVAFANARHYAEIQQSLDDISRVKSLMDNVFASIGSGVIASDAQDIVTIFNRAAESILETPADSMMGRSLKQVLPRITTELSEFLAAVREKGEGHIMDAERITSNQNRMALSLKLTPLRDANDATRGVAVVVDDVTAQVAREQELRVMKTYLPPELVDTIHTISSLELGGERRKVTCMFAEVIPLSRLKDHRPPEIMDIVNEHLVIATDCIHDTQGVIDKYMGNEVMALYNSQLSPQQNHAWLAVEAAMMMRDAYAQFYEQRGIAPDPHYYRVGIHTGEATLGNVGSFSRRDFTAIGDSINLAKRLQENAASGQIIVSAATYQYLKASSQAKPLPYELHEHAPIQVKGRKQQTRIYEVFRKA